MISRAVIIALLGIVGALLAGCGGAAPTHTPSPTATQARLIVTLPPRPTPQIIGVADHSAGPENAFLTIVIYGDFQCEPCRDLARTLLVLRQRYPADVRVVWRHFPTPENDKAALAAQAAEAAAAQGKFWELHDQLFAAQGEWLALPVDQFRARLTDYARMAGVPTLEVFDNALDSRQYAALVDAAAREALARGFKRAPVLTFRDQPYSGRIDEFGLESVLRLILLEKRQFKSQPALQIDLNKRYTATLITEKGRVTIDLFTRAAPVAVNNFVFLARQGWYNDITFHLVTPEIAQTGDPSGTGLGGAGYTIADEHQNGLIFDREGLVAMGNQRGVPNSASSQFFITFGPLPPEGFNGQYTIFGQVVQGMDVLRALTPRNPFDELRFPNPPPGDKLIRVEISEGGP